MSSLKSQWAEILVAPRVEEVEGEPLVLEAHHRRGDRDAALALDRHPIRAHPPPLAARLHFARQLDRPAKQAAISRSVSCSTTSISMTSARAGCSCVCALPTVLCSQDGSPNSTPTKRNSTPCRPGRAAGILPLAKARRRSTALTMAARPSKIKMIACDLSDSITTIAIIARTSVSATTCAVGSPFAANGTARQIVQISRASRTVRAGSRNRSCQGWINLRRSSATTALC